MRKGCDKVRRKARVGRGSEIYLRFGDFGVGVDKWRLRDNQRHLLLKLLLLMHLVLLLQLHLLVVIVLVNRLNGRSDIIGLHLMLRLHLLLLVLNNGRKVW